MRDSAVVVAWLVEPECNVCVCEKARHSQRWLGRPMGRVTGGGEVCLSQLQGDGVASRQHDMYVYVFVCYETITPKKLGSEK